MKVKANRTINCLKVRLITNGTNQIEDIDFHETFSPVVKPIMIQLVLSIALTRDWKLCQIDIGNAFLNDMLKVNILMQHPVGFIDNQFPH